MRCLWISNNYGSIKDAIGRHVFKLIKVIRSNYKDVHVNVIYGNTFEKTKKQWLYSLTMTKVILGAKKEIKKDVYDVICLEYPFVEWNPLIVPAFAFLCRQAHKKNIKVSVSVHEYLRSNRIRKLVVRKMLQKADFAFVTDSANKKELEKISKCYYRSIPSSLTIEDFDVSNKIFDKSFVYVGLVNNSKAFYEMIEAFSYFSINNECRLDIYTCSDINCMEYENIFIHKNEPDNVLEDALKRSTYCIVPSIPDITLCNGTLKVAAQAGCTVIGKFSEDIIDICSFGINVDNYSLEAFRKGLEAAFQLSDSELLKNAMAGINFGMDFSYAITAEEMVTTFRKEL